MNDDDPPIGVTRRECTLCKEGIVATIMAETTKVSAEIKALRRELALGITISTTLIAIFIALLQLGR